MKLLAISNKEELEELAQQINNNLKNIIDREGSGVIVPVSDLFAGTILEHKKFDTNYGWMINERCEEIELF